MPLLGHDITVIRNSPGHLEGGLWVNGEETTFTIRGSVRPIKPQSDLFLPQGRDLTSAIQMFSDTRLKVAKPDGDTPGDRVIVEGSVYECIKEYPWQNNILPHWKYIICYLHEYVAPQGDGNEGD